MAKTKVQREREKKQRRRSEEFNELKGYGMQLHKPVPPKKPAEFKFDKSDVNSFEYPVVIGNTVLEKKSDGYCVHISVDHKKRDKVKIYSSGSNEWNPECFPEVVKDLLRLPSGYYHGELLGLKPEGAKTFTSLDEFIAIENRPKLNAGNLTKSILETYPLKLDLFDVLMLDKRVMLAEPFERRRAALEGIVGGTAHLNVIPQWNAADKNELHKLFLWAINNDYEGLIAKDPSSLYVPGSRDNDWIKLKEFLTLDLAVLGLYGTPESIKAGKPFSAILVGSYNASTRKFETMAKIKVNSKNDQEEIYERLKSVVDVEGDYGKAIKACNRIAFNPSMEKIKRKIPERIAKYGQRDDIIVVEIKALDVTYSDNWHSCGLSYDGKKAHSLRIATFEQLRGDKTRVRDVTTTQQIHNYYLGSI